MKYTLGLLVTACVLCRPGPAQTPQGNPMPLRLSLQDALERAQKYSPQTLSANLAALLAREDSVQAKAALLPSVNGLSQFIYTQPNGSPSGTFISNDGQHVYNDQMLAHADIFSPEKRADYRRALAAEAAARARADVAARGLFATVTSNYYGMAVAERKVVNARQAVKDAQHFFDISKLLEQGGEAALADTIKAQMPLVKAQADEREAQLNLDKARIGFAVLLFPDYRQDFSVIDDLDTVVPLPALNEAQTLAGRNNPEIRAAQLTVEQQQHELDSARAARLPSFSIDYFLGINSNQFAVHNHEGLNQIGSVVQAQITVPVWTWGAAKSRVRQADIKLLQARNDLTFTQRQLLSELDSSYREAELSRFQIASLRELLELSQKNLDFTLTRYQAGEALAQEVVDAQGALRDARNAYDDGLARYRVAIGALQSLTGVF